MPHDLALAAAILEENGLDLAKLIFDSNTQTMIRLSSLLDKFFELAIKARLLAQGDEIRDRDFVKDGRFATTHKKIITASDWSIISATAIRDADILRKIRNKMAHAREWLHFESPAIEELAKGLSGYNPLTPNQNQNAILAAHSQIIDELQKAADAFKARTAANAGCSG